VKDFRKDRREAVFLFVQFNSPCRPVAHSGGSPQRTNTSGLSGKPDSLPTRLREPLLTRS
jgi:hypothetical protein